MNATATQIIPAWGRMKKAPGPWQGTRARHATKDNDMTYSDIDARGQAETRGGSARATALTIREGRMKITPAIARRILQEHNYDRQRPVMKHHVALLADLMFRRKWSEGSQIAFGRLNGRLHMVNGQHRMHAVMEASATIEVQALIVDVATDDELRALYYRFDVAQRGRSKREILRSSGTADANSVTCTMAEAVMQAVPLLRNGLILPHYQTNPEIRSPDYLLEQSEIWWPHARAFEACIAPSIGVFRRRLFAAAIVAPALATLRYQPERATAFWAAVAENDGLRRGDVRWLLVQSLIEPSKSGDTWRRTAIVTLAWNAWFEGRRLQILKVPQNYTIRLAGTPYTGKEG